MELREFNMNSTNNKSKNDMIENVLENLKPLKQTQKSIHCGHRERLKSQFIKSGLESITDIQKLELLLFFAIPQKDTNPIAHNLLNEFGSFKNVIEADYSKLIEVSGVKENSALLINLVNSISNYSHKPNTKYYINSTHAAMEFVKSLYHGITVEQFYVICIAKDNSVLKYDLVNSGLIDEVTVQIRDITKIAIDNKVNRIIVCHNHPNGLAELSDEDYSFTYNLLCSCILNSIELLDHIIIGTNGAYSCDEFMVLQKAKARVYKKLEIPTKKIDFLSSLSKNYIRSQEFNVEYKFAD